MPRSLQKMLLLQVHSEALSSPAVGWQCQHHTELSVLQTMSMAGLDVAQEAARSSGRRDGGRAQPRQVAGTSTQACLRLMGQPDQSPQAGALGPAAVLETRQRQPEEQAGPTGADGRQQPQSCSAPHVATQAKQPAAAVQHPEAEPGKSRLKQRKKEYLKRRKLKRSGRIWSRDGSAAEVEEDLEARLLQDVHKPRFGEQALAPLKVM